MIVCWLSVLLLSHSCLEGSIHLVVRRGRQGDSLLVEYVLLLSHSCLEDSIHLVVRRGRQGDSLLVEYVLLLSHTAA